MKDSYTPEQRATLDEAIHLVLLHLQLEPTEAVYGEGDMWKEALIEIAARVAAHGANVLEVASDA